MSDHKAKPAGVAPPHQIPPLTTSHQPPTGITPIFNAAAAKPTQSQAQAKQAAMKPMGANQLKERLKEIRASLSRPASTLELTALGSTVRGINRERNTQLSKELVQISARLRQATKLGKVRHDFATSASQGVAKQAFNRAAKRSM